MLLKGLCLHTKRYCTSCTHETEQEKKKNYLHLILNIKKVVQFLKANSIAAKSMGIFELVV